MCIGEPRLRSSGVDIPKHSVSSPEIRLYEMLSILHGDGAHSKYNALIRRLVSFERAAESGTQHTKKGLKVARVRTPVQDVYGRAVAKIERGHDQDMRDVVSMIRAGVTDPTEAETIRPSINGMYK